MKIVLRKEAISKSLKTYFTGVECKHGHVSERYTTTGGCLECLRGPPRDNSARSATRDLALEMAKRRLDLRERSLKFKEKLREDRLARAAGQQPQTVADEARAKARAEREHAKEVRAQRRTMIAATSVVEVYCRLEHWPEVRDCAVALVQVDYPLLQMEDILPAGAGNKPLKKVRLQAHNVSMVRKIAEAFNNLTPVQPVVGLHALPVVQPAVQAILDKMDGAPLPSWVEKP